MHAPHLTSLDERFWRMMFVAWAGDLLAPAQNPEGRFHYDGQRALYLSASPEGCIAASKRYVTHQDPERAIYPIRVKSNRLVDLRDPAAVAHFGIDVTHRAAEWQDIRASGMRSPTWDISDRVRALELQGMLYASRTDPTKTHLTLFDWNSDTGAIVSPDGSSMAWLGQPEG